MTTKEVDYAAAGRIQGDYFGILAARMCTSKDKAYVARWRDLQRKLVLLNAEFLREFGATDDELNIFIASADGAAVQMLRDLADHIDAQDRAVCPTLQ